MTVARTVASSLAVLVLAACGAPAAPAPPTTFTLSGTVQLTNISAIQAPDTMSCHGSGGYADLSPGTAVAVMDPRGLQMATGAIGTGKPQFKTMHAPALGIGPTTVLAQCDLEFEVPGVPDGEPSYTVVISGRGQVVFSASQAHYGGGTLIVN